MTDAYGRAGYQPGNITNLVGGFDLRKRGVVFTVLHDGTFGYVDDPATGKKGRDNQKDQ